MIAPRGGTLALRTAPSWPLAVLFLSGLMSCGGEESAVPSPDDMSASSAPGQEPDVLRLAPDECPPDALSGEPDLWTEPDSVLLGPGLILELQGCESEGNGWRTYSYDGPTPVTPYHVVEVHYYEGVSWLILNAEGRQWQVVRSRPLSLRIWLGSRQPGLTLRQVLTRGISTFGLWRPTRYDASWPSTAGWSGVPSTHIGPLPTDLSTSVSAGEQSRLPGCGLTPSRPV